MASRPSLTHGWEQGCVDAVQDHFHTGGKVGVVALHLLFHKQCSQNATSYAPTRTDNGPRTPVL